MPLWLAGRLSLARSPLILSASNSAVHAVHFSLYVYAVASNRYQHNVLSVSANN